MYFLILFILVLSSLMFDFFALLFDFVLRIVLSSLIFDIIMLEILMLMLLPC